MKYFISHNSHDYVWETDLRKKKYIIKINENLKKKVKVKSYAKIKDELCLNKYKYNIYKYLYIM